MKSRGRMLIWIHHALAYSVAQAEMRIAIEGRTREAKLARTSRQTRGPLVIGWVSCLGLEALSTEE